MLWCLFRRLIRRWKVIDLVWFDLIWQTRIPFPDSHAGGQQRSDEERRHPQKQSIASWQRHSTNGLFPPRCGRNAAAGWSHPVGGYARPLADGPTHALTLRSILRSIPRRPTRNGSCAWEHGPWATRFHAFCSHKSYPSSCAWIGTVDVSRGSGGGGGGSARDPGRSLPWFCRNADRIGRRPLRHSTAPQSPSWILRAQLSVSSKCSTQRPIPRGITGRIITWVTIWIVAWVAIRIPTWVTSWIATWILTGIDGRN